MNAKMVIRDAQVDEADALSALVLASKASNGYDISFMEQCREELSIRESDILSGHFLVAVEGDNLLGVVCFVRHDTERSQATVTTFFVDPEHKRKGVGRALWQRLVDVAKAQGIINLTLDADPFAVPFYEALGFRKIGLAPSGSIEGRFLDKMEYWLTTR